MALHSSYFNRPGEVEPNPGVKSPPSTRPMSALPLVTILRGQGLRKVIEGLRSPLVAMHALADTLENEPDVEVLHQPDTGILCFRMKPDGTPAQDLDSLQRKLYQRINSSGERSISMAKIGGQTALRLVVISAQADASSTHETTGLCGPTQNRPSDISGEKVFDRNRRVRAWRRQSSTNTN